MLPEKPVLVLAFLDITTSVDEKSIDNVIEKATALVSSLPPKSKIAAYPIDSNTYPEKLFDFEIPDCDNPNLTGRLANKAKENCVNSNKTKIGEFANNIKNRHDELKNNTSIKQKSCIIDTLGKVNEFYKNVNKEQYRFEVIYLSDMIEECHSEVGAIFLCSKRQNSGKEGILKQIEENYNPNFDIKQLVGSNIAFVITTRMLGNNQHNCLFQSDHKEIWEKVFTKVGYSKEDFRSFPFSQDLPDKFTISIKGE